MTFTYTALYSLEYMKLSFANFSIDYSTKSCLLPIFRIQTLSERSSVNDERNSYKTYIEFYTIGTMFLSFVILVVLIDHFNLYLEDHKMYSSKPSEYGKESVR